MGHKPNWRPEEDAYLSEAWGTVSVEGIAKHLNRTPSAIKLRAGRLGLGAFLESGDYVTMNQLMIALGRRSAYSYTLISWAENRGFPVRTKKRSNKSTVRVVYIDEFWAWAEKHRSFIDFSKMEPLILGAEPDWVAEQRRNDYRSFAEQRKDPWTSAEDNRLKTLLQMQKYGYAELSELLRRSEGAIQRRINDLGIKARPLKAPKHGEGATWTPEHFRILADGIRRGTSYNQIAKRIGKSEKAVRGKVYMDYLTENADKVRAMLSDGEWGHGVPEPTVRQAVHHSRYRTETRAQLEQVAGLMLLRLRQLRKDDYFWQKEICRNWSDLKGCTKGCEDCDLCTDFVRIQPQYCCRCGASFIERTEQRFCPACRTARRKQAQRHWARENKK